AISGWCSIVGHRQMGMTLEIIPVDTSGKPVTGNQDENEHEHPGNSTGGHEISGTPGELFRPYSPELAPLTATAPTVHKITFNIAEELIEVAPGVTQTLWTYNGSAP